MPPVVRSWLAAGLAVAASAAPAAAQQTIAPPGNAGVQQYLETVPSARGNTAPSGPAGARSHHDPAVPSSVTTRLQQHGEEGRKLEALVAATGPSSRSKGIRRSSRPEPTPRSSAFHSAAAGLTAGSGSGGMGLLLPALLLGSAIVLGGIAVRRRRG
jgi:hypothetical protein